MRVNAMKRLPRKRCLLNNNLAVLTVTTIFHKLRITLNRAKSLIIAHIEAELLLFNQLSSELTPEGYGSRATRFHSSHRIRRGNS